MKKVIAVLLAVTVVFALIACGADKYAELKIGNITGFGQNILNRVAFEKTLSEVSGFEYAAEQLKIDKSKLNYVNNEPEMYRAMAAPEEILIIGAKDAAAAKDILNGPINDWVKYQRDGYADYGPDQVPKLDSCVKMTAGRYVFLIISDTREEAESKGENAKAVLTELLDTALKIHD